jgi:hypothetical protein
MCFIVKFPVYVFKMTSIYGKLYHKDSVVPKISEFNRRLLKEKFPEHKNREYNGILLKILQKYIYIYISRKGCSCDFQSNQIIAIKCKKRVHRWFPV